jgi:RNA polymerase sigma-70 factor (ECF subfamily)
MPSRRCRPGGHEQPEALLERKALAEELVRRIEALPAAQRETFLLSEEGELTLEEIAAATGVNRETAKSRLRYALNKLRAGLKELR